ncbi:MAG TPA: DNA-directed RNA polymerase subunit beta' [Clostridia bacterium]|nr:DNA-directed RNA polymerase subunit beta' [Clostridia bacterium]
MPEINNFDSIQISIASPEKIREWSHGEVLKPETINYRTQKPERDGLFCERIFGPIKDYECHCGKYKRIRYKGVICDKCGVEVTKSKVRRERMGHIELAAPVCHIWYFRGVPSRISTILNISPKQVEQVIYFAAFIVLDPGKTNFYKKQVIKEEERLAALEQFGPNSFRAGMGAEAVKELLREIDLDKESEELKEAVAIAQGLKKAKLAKRLEIVESFRRSGNRPEWMILDVLPVLPPELRPMVQLDGGRFATSDLNDLYRRVINRNNRLKKIIESGAPDIMIRNEKRMLQEAVDSLIDNGRHGKAVTGASNRTLKSLSTMLSGKTGRFRQNLLGKRVDYSGRSVIVVGPELKLYQCGLPKEMALELFKPFVFRKLVEKEICSNIKSAKRTVERVKPVVWDILEEVIKDHPVLLNRAPTLHRLGIQAFEPVLVEGRAIKLHPLACTAFNADFDGDQMAVHVPLSLEAQAEARILMLASNNILKLSDGQSIVTPTQDMVLGTYYLTQEKDMPEDKSTIRHFKDSNEAKMAYQVKEIGLQDWIRVRVIKNIDGVEYRGVITTTVGKIIFNEAIPQDLGFVKRNPADTQSMIALEIQSIVKKKTLGQIVDRCFRLKGATATAEVLDRIKSLGFKFSTVSGMTTSVFDMKIPGYKKDILDKAEKEVIKIEKNFKRGLITEEERYKEVIDIWTGATTEVEKDLESNFRNFDRFNPIWMMADSGARGSMQQIKQLSGMRGLMNDPSGRIIEIPVKSSFREGLSVLEYFISSHGARKGGADTAIKTADSGYLTRRLVDVSQDVIINEIDCGDTKGVLVNELDYGSGVESLEERINGRYTIGDVVNPATGEIIVANDEMISEDAAKAIKEAGIKSVRIRNILTCKCKRGLCSKCYGANMSSSNPVKLGEAVGIIAAQSIGEPGTQLTMRTFHTGGVASSADITLGLPRVQELVEARKPKGYAPVADFKGRVTVKIDDNGRADTVIITNDELSKEYKVPQGIKVLINDGEEVEAGTQIYAGNVNPHEVLKTQGVAGVQEFMIKEIQKAYRSNGVHINDKHIEIIVRQMLRKVRINNPNDTDLLYNELVDISRLEEANEKALENGGIPATAIRVLLGITKAALATDSFLSAASFQETARVLTEAAIKAKTDSLVGLKENVIIGKLIPAGTGMKMYRNIRLVEDDEILTGSSDNAEEETRFNGILDNIDAE